MVREHTQTDTDSLIARHIEPYPGDARIAEYRLRVEDGGVPVWAIIGAATETGDNLDAVARAYHTSREAVEAAWAFYQRHRAAIDARLDENDPA